MWREALHERDGPLLAAAEPTADRVGHITSIQSHPYHLARLPIIFPRHYYSFNLIKLLLALQILAFQRAFLLFSGIGSSNLELLP